MPPKPVKRPSSASVRLANELAVRKTLSKTSKQVAIPPELVALATRTAKAAGVTATEIAALQVLRADRTHERVHSVLRPSLCFLVQGAKEVTVGSEVLRYHAGEFLFSSVELPITGEVVQAVPGRPYLCLVVEIDPGVVFELASAAAGFFSSPSSAERAIFVGQSDEMMTHAFLRLMSCLGNRMDVEVLAPIILREITFRLLMGPYGDTLRELVVVGSQTQRVAKAIDRLKHDFMRPLRVEELAQVAGMSASSFHQHFKKVTALSPLQYQKQLRLQEARRLLFGDAGGAGDVAFRVGYESPSQFSREYARFFGVSPSSDVKAHRELARAG